jgi:hypothetical protein
MLRAVRDQHHAMMRPAGVSIVLRCTHVCLQVSDMLLGGKDLAFYQYGDDVNTLLDKVGRSNSNMLVKLQSNIQSLSVFKNCFC